MEVVFKSVWNKIKDRMTKTTGAASPSTLSATALRSFLTIMFVGMYPLSQSLVFSDSLVSLQEIHLADIQGTVQSKTNSEPVMGALVELPHFGESAYSDEEGHFAFYDLALPSEIYPTRITITAAGHGLWTIIDVRLVAQDTLLLEATLEVDPVTITVPEINHEALPDSKVLNALSESLDPTFDQRDLPLPATIRVAITNNVAVCDSNASYTVEVVDFKEYAKNVLPNEWIVSWPRESLRAGAMAVKMFAWYWVAAGGRLDDADVMDSVCDQVYVPGVAYSSTNNAVDFTWNWRLTHQLNGNLFRTHYMSEMYWCEYYGWQGRCMGQWETKYHAEGNDGYDKLTWDEMLFRYYWDSELTYVPHLPPAEFNLRFYGNGWGDFDRVKILIDDPQDGHIPADVGATDFTIEWWMKSMPGDNTSQQCTPGGENWMDGNVILDRDVIGDGDHGEYGVSLMDGRIVFGVNNGTSSQTLCGTISVADNQWHHVALTRNVNSGLMRIFVDGILDVGVVGPTGDISYRDGRGSQEPDQDPYLIIGARKLDQGLAFSGWLDELRISNIIRYTETFLRPESAFDSDDHTMALYHFDVGYGNTIRDLSGALEGPSNGSRIYGGDPKNGPEWGVSLLFLFQKILIPLVEF